MKKIRKRVCTLLLCLLVFTYFNVGAYSGEIAASTREQNNAEATQGYTRLVESFDRDGLPTEPSYPENYGGAYIDESGKLVVLYVDNIAQNSSLKEEPKQLARQQVCNITELQDVDINCVEYSYNELLTANNKIGDYIKVQYGSQSELKKETHSDTRTDFEVVQSAIDTKNNAVVIWMNDLSYEAIQAFRESVCDEPFLVFKLATEWSVDVQASYKSGSGWVNGDGSIGFPAKRGTRSGFVTAYHCANSGVNSINGKDYGMMDTASSEEYDFAFIWKAYSADTISRSIYDTTQTLMANSYTYAIQGSSVGRSGVGSGFSSGTVQYTGVNNELGEDLIVTNCSSVGGDSGGPYFSSPSSSTPIITGIHIGIGTTSSTTYAYFRSVQYIREAGIQID